MNISRMKDKRSPKMYSLMLLGSLANINPAIALTQPNFIDVIPNAVGINALGEGMFGGGAAWIDYNNDGYADLFIPTESISLPSGTPSGNPSHFYRNNKDGSFTEVTQTANVALTGRNCTGAAVGDINNDGFDDLFVICGVAGTINLPVNEVFEIEKNAMLLNNGDGTFSDITDSAGLHSTSARRPSYAAAFGDLDGDGDLDLYVGNYLSTRRNCVSNQLFTNNGDNTFTDKTAELNVGGSGCTLAVVMTDYDMDGDLDIFEINDFAAEGKPPNSMFQNNGAGQAFTNVAADIGLDAAVYGMGIAIADYDNDADLDYYLTSVGANVLHQNNGALFFTNAAPAANVENILSHPDYTNLSVGWGTVFLDANNDGFQDLYVTNGSNGFGLNEGCGFAFLRCTNQLYINSGAGVFEEATTASGAADEQGSPLSVAVADYDRDGDVDMLVTNVTGPQNLYSNTTTEAGNYLQVRLQGSSSNRRGIGAKVRVIVGRGTQQIVQLQELHAGSSHGSNHELMLHFGLGAAIEARQVIIEWPMGCRQVIEYVPAGDALIKENCSPPHVLTGQVVYNGVGLANATVIDAVRFPRVAAVTTDAYGIFTIENFRSDQQVVLSAAAAETSSLFIPDNFIITTLGDGDSFNNRFEAAAIPGSITGYLTTPAGDGVSNHEVWDYWSLPELATTDVNGFYVLSGFTLNQDVLVIPGHDISAAPTSSPGYRFIPNHNGGVHTGFDFILDN